GESVGEPAGSEGITAWERGVTGPSDALRPVMDLPEQPELLPPRLPAPALAPETPDYLEQELFEFKRLFHALLVALLAPVLAGTIYFAKQMRLVRGELAEY